jgi:hypothetical protein
MVHEQRDAEAGGGDQRPPAHERDVAEAQAERVRREARDRHGDREGREGDRADRL